MITARDKEVYRRAYQQFFVDYANILSNGHSLMPQEVARLTPHADAVTKAAKTPEAATRDLIENNDMWENVRDSHIDDIKISG